MMLKHVSNFLLHLLFKRQFGCELCLRQVGGIAQISAFPLLFLWGTTRNISRDYIALGLFGQFSTSLPYSEGKGPYPAF